MTERLGGSLLIRRRLALLPSALLCPLCARFRRASIVPLQRPASCSAPQQKGEQPQRKRKISTELNQCRISCRHLSYVKSVVRSCGAYRRSHQHEQRNSEKIFGSTSEPPFEAVEAALWCQSVCKRPLRPFSTPSFELRGWATNSAVRAHPCRKRGIARAKIRPGRTNAAETVTYFGYGLRFFMSAEQVRSSFTSSNRFLLREEFSEILLGLPDEIYVYYVLEPGRASKKSTRFFFAAHGTSYSDSLPRRGRGGCFHPLHESFAVGVSKTARRRL